jgi:hypothetical protein
MPRNFKVEELLSRDELDEFEKFAGEPARTIDESHDWLLTRGFTLGRTAVGNWLREFRERAMHDRVRQSIESSERFVAVAKEAGVAGMASASLARFQQLLFEAMVRDEELDAGDLMKFSIALKTAVAAGQQIEALKSTFDKQVQAAQSKRPDGVITQDDINSVRKAMFG